MARKRRKRGRNRGYFYRSSHKCWVATAGNRFVPLTDPNGNRIRDPEADQNELRDAYARFRLTQPNDNGTALPLAELGSAI